MIDPTQYELWFVTGSQHLYGDQTLASVEADARAIATALGSSQDVPLSIVSQPVMTGPDQIDALARAANADPRCAGVIAWMHTFSPARMWLGFLDELRVPLLHLHTQFARDLPWSTIDMDYMNCHQSAHGDREFGYLATRLRHRREVVAGHWGEERVTHRIGVWARAALAAADARAARIGRLGDNMREVAVTEGDKVEWQRRIGHRVNGYGAADLVRRFHDVRSGETDALCDEYATVYKVADELLPGAERHGSLRTAAAIELALRGFLADEGLVGFTDTFEDLAGLPQLPGIAAQRLMADGYGFGAEGDWKTAALVRAVKVMGHGLPGGTSFMEDYTYHLDPAGQLVLGAHMLEVCPSLARDVPRCEVHPLSIGGAEDPVRLVFDAAAGPAVNMAVVDLGDRLRMTICPVEVVAPPEPLPRLPVARSVWKHNPDLATAAEAWILAGGSHHSVHSQAVTAAHLRSFARMLDIESVLIGPDLDIADLERELRWTDAAYRLASR